MDIFPIFAIGISFTSICYFGLELVYNIAESLGKLLGYDIADVYLLEMMESGMLPLWVRIPLRANLVITIPN